MGIGSHTKPNRGESDRWITPPEILAALGTFDLDPCADESQPWQTAAESYTIHDNGLRKPWHGRVWLNPPYSDVWQWMGRLGNHGHGTALIFARTETEGFFRTVWEQASGLLFLRKRLYFCLPNGDRAGGNAGGPSVLVAYGPTDAMQLARCGLPGTFIENWNVSHGRRIESDTDGGECSYRHRDLFDMGHGSDQRD